MFSLPVNSRNQLVLLVVRCVGEGIDVGSQAGRGGSFYTCDMVIDADLRVSVNNIVVADVQRPGLLATDLFWSALDWVLDQMN